MKNRAFIDAQNLYLGTTKSNVPWNIDLKRFRIYLSEKYDVEEAYYFLGYVDDANQDLYSNIQKAGFILIFRNHSYNMLSHKKGNVDTDIVFSIMRMLYKNENFDQVILVSGDGDYAKMVDFLIKEEKFKKILLPDSSKASSLYKRLDAKYRDNIDNPSIKNKIKLHKIKTGSP